MCNSKIILMTLALFGGGVGCAHAQLLTPTPGPDIPQPLPVPEAEAIDDERILQITHVTNEAEIDAAKLAEARAVDGGVRAFARSIARDHTKSERENEEIARVSGLNPQISQTSSNLQTGQHDKLLVLGSKIGAAFDRAYVDDEVDTQRAALKLIDDRLLPNATTDQVKTMVQRIRPEIAKQYSEAKALQEKLKD